VERYKRLELETPPYVSRTITICSPRIAPAPLDMLHQTRIQILVGVRVSMVDGVVVLGVGAVSKRRR
jgi:hypothetical protein